MSVEDRAIFELSEPIPLTNLMVRRPCCFLSTGFAILLVISAFAAVMGWLIPQDPYERDYFVWGDEYVNAYDKTLLASRELLATVDGEVAPLQSQIITDWTIMLVYRGKLKNKGKANMWTRENLMLIREFEKDVRKNGNYKRTCLAAIDDKANKNEVVCGDSSFLSPLDLLSDDLLLDNMTQEDLDSVLVGIMNN